MSETREWLKDLDPGIAPFVSVLDAAGIETYESCEGTKGHAFPEPAIRFHGGPAEGFRALAIAVEHALPVCDLRRSWWVSASGEPNGPTWEIVFSRPATLDEHEAAKAQVPLTYSSSKLIRVAN